MATVCLRDVKAQCPWPGMGVNCSSTIADTLYPVQSVAVSVVIVLLSSLVSLYVAWRLGNMLLVWCSTRTSAVERARRRCYCECGSLDTQVHVLTLTLTLSVLVGGLDQFAYRGVYSYQMFVCLEAVGLSCGLSGMILTHGRWMTVAAGLRARRDRRFKRALWTYLTISITAALLYSLFVALAVVVPGPEVRSHAGTSRVLRLINLGLLIAVMLGVVIGTVSIVTIIVKQLESAAPRYARAPRGSRAGSASGDSGEVPAIARRHSEGRATPPSLIGATRTARPSPARGRPSPARGTGAASPWSRVAMERAQAAQGLQVGRDGNTAGSGSSRRRCCGLCRGGRGAAGTVQPTPHQQQQQGGGGGGAELRYSTSAGGSATPVPGAGSDARTKCCCCSLRPSSKRVVVTASLFVAGPALGLAYVGGVVLPGIIGQSCVYFAPSMERTPFASVGAWGSKLVGAVMILVIFRPKANRIKELRVVRHRLVTRFSTYLPGVGKVAPLSPPRRSRDRGRSGSGGSRYGPVRALRVESSGSSGSSHAASVPASPSALPHAHKPRKSSRLVNVAALGELKGAAVGSTSALGRSGLRRDSTVDDEDAATAVTVFTVEQHRPSRMSEPTMLRVRRGTADSSLTHQSPTANTPGSSHSLNTTVPGVVATESEEGIPTSPHFSVRMHTGELPPIAP